VKFVIGASFLYKNKVKFVIRALFLYKNRVKFVIAALFFYKNGVKFYNSIPFLSRKNTDLTDNEMFKDKGSEPGAFIYLHITVDGVGCDISTKRKSDPAKWNGGAGRAEGKTEAVKSLNSYLDLLQRKVYEARQQLLHHGHPVTAENIKTVFYGKEIQTHKYMLMEVFKKHNDQMAELVGLEIARGTLELFQTAYGHTLNFLQWKYKVDDRYQ
jgi:hypothetical protein